MPFRLPPDQMRRLEKAAHSVKKSKQSFVQEIVLERVAEIEENKRFNKQISRDDVYAKTPKEEMSPVGGLGISSALRQPLREVSEPVTAAPQSPVVVQVGNTSAPTTASAASLGDLDRLALFIVKGEDFMRSMRKRTVVEILEMTSASPEECKVLVARVEELVAAKAKVAEQEKVGNKLAHIAFEKLAALIKGD